MTRASSALVRDTPLPSSRRANGWAVPRSLGRSSTTGPAVVHGQLGEAVAIPGTLPLAAGVAVTAQELADLGLQGGLHDQWREPCCIRLQDYGLRHD
jgi:hypothetical protein